MPLLHCLLKGILLVGTKTFCLSEQQMIDEDIDSSGYDPSSEEDEEREMQDESRGQGNKNTAEQQSAVGKQDKVEGKEETKAY